MTFVQITGITFNSLRKRENGVCAECTVELDNSMAIHKVRVIRGNKGLYVAMPNTGVSYVGSNGKRKILDVVHPTTSEFQRKFDDEVLREYKKVTENK